MNCEADKGEERKQQIAERLNYVSALAVIDGNMLGTFV